LDIPFVDRGRDWNGCDCWGLVRLIATHEFGRGYPMLSGRYETSEDGNTVQELIDTERSKWQEIKAGQEKFGDFVTLFVKGAECHVGTVLSENRLIQTMKSTGPTIERYDRNPWKKRVRKFYRWKL